jgi:cbb3-type cytochrome oxidase subunit 3
MAKKRIKYVFADEDGYYDPMPRTRHRYLYDPDPFIQIPIWVWIMLTMVVGAGAWKTVVDPMWIDRIIGIFNPAYAQSTEEQKKAERDFWIQVLILIFAIVFILAFAWIYVQWRKGKEAKAVRIVA